VSGTRAPGVLPGLDLGRLTEHLRLACPGLAAGALEAKIIAGGRSNLTYAVTDGTSRWVLRRPPLGHVLDTAHDMAREFRVLSALGGTAVPVPATVHLCQDATVLGAPFYLMEHAPGATYRSRAELELLGPPRARALSTELVRTLARLHSVRPADVGLEDFGRPEGFLERQVRRWNRQLEASLTRPRVEAAELRHLLERAVPTGGGRGGILHGDFRLDNVLVGADDRITAVLDWEMATLGDPLTDLALMLAYGRLAVKQGPEGGLPDVTLAPGYLTANEIVDVYAHERGVEVSELGFHLGLAFFKLAAILEGIHARHLSGQTVGEGFETAGALVEPALAAGLASIKERTP
jgi:aminoglycoside phosphotransferase (APT) family kinase protein